MRRLQTCRTRSPKAPPPAVQSVRDVHGVARARQDERREDDIRPGESCCRNHEIVFEKWHRRRRARKIRRERYLPEVDAQRDAGRDLAGKLVPLDEATILFAAPFLLQLQIIVEEAD